MVSSIIMVGEKRDRDHTSIMEREELRNHFAKKMRGQELQTNAEIAIGFDAEVEAAGPFDQSDEQLDQSMNSHEAASKWEEEDGSEVSCAGLDDLEDEEEGKEVSMDWVLGMENPEPANSDEDQAEESTEEDVSPEELQESAEHEAEDSEEAEDPAAPADWEEPQDVEIEGTDNLSDADFEEEDNCPPAADLDRELTPELLAENSEAFPEEPEVPAAESSTQPCEAAEVDLDAEVACPMAPPPLEDF